ncbi:hypothetical protein RFI_22988 [Reticulomyxa filosa]|uniref:Guanylate cyclase domain-containing protein n=1 Tax=Reticulomyxa filosa TaxID=46433 RepID=X6MLU1_RETFI|nr:hypothetical protein RFI_22988 [Reticulomyxa filosa]|eukprot:ETO14382.1 hypothetical protein RFI_22988 [Reticulomyxa filosa]
MVYKLNMLLNFCVLFIKINKQYNKSNRTSFEQVSEANIPKRLHPSFDYPVDEKVDTFTDNDSELSQTSSSSSNNENSLEHKNSDSKKEIVSYNLCNNNVPFQRKKNKKETDKQISPNLKSPKLSAVLYDVQLNLFFKKRNLIDLVNEKHIVTCFQNDYKWRDDTNPYNNNYCKLFFAYNVKFKIYLSIVLTILDAQWASEPFNLAFVSRLLGFTHTAVAVSGITEKKKEKEQNKDENANVLIESQLPLKTADYIFDLYLFASTLRMILLIFYTGRLFQLCKYKNELLLFSNWSFLNRLLDILLIHSLLFLSYLWYQFRQVKYRSITIVLTANLLYFTNILSNDNTHFTWKDIFYSCVLLNCGTVSMVNCLHLASKQQINTLIEVLFHRVQLHLERKEHTRIMNSLMPAPVTEQILLKGETPVYERDVTVGFVYFTFYEKLTMQKVKHNSLCMETLHHIVINFDKVDHVNFMFVTLILKEIEKWEFDVVKIEHVGNAYLVCGGIMSSDSTFNHAEAIIRLGLRFRRIMDKLNKKLQIHSKLTMGIHSGPVIGTIIGTTRKFFRIFGDTVNTTSRVCTTGLEGCIQLTQQTYGLITILYILYHFLQNKNFFFFADMNEISRSFDCTVRGDIQMKGKGNIHTYIVHGLSYIFLKRHKIYKCNICILKKKREWDIVVNIIMDKKTYQTQNNEQFDIVGNELLSISNIT